MTKFFSIPSIKTSIEFLKANWFRVSILVLACFVLYWFGIRPSQIRADCAWITIRYDAIPAVQASANWPQCEDEIANIKMVQVNPGGKKVWDQMLVPADPEYLANLKASCKAPKDAVPERTERREVNPTQYAACLRKAGL